ncbi:hypothetical protein Q7O_003782 [Pectobacterium carotovorum subsp. carotovorum PCCS1]|nr:hypothetical protein [Pectobacterium carotovorum subsp. carotovorum PCCS1]
MTVFDDPLLLLALVLMVVGIYLARTQHKTQQYKQLEIRMRGHLPVASIEAASQENILRGQGTTLSPLLEKLLQPVATQGERLSGSERDRRNLRRLLDLAGIRRNEAVGWLVMGKFAAGALFAIALVWGWLPPADRAGLTGVGADWLLCRFYGAGVVAEVACGKPGRKAGASGAGCAGSDGGLCRSWSAYRARVAGGIEGAGAVFTGDGG